MEMSLGLWIILGAVLLFPFLSFLFVVSLGYWNNRNLDLGEMRRAITVFFIVLFGLLVAVSFFPGGVDLPKEIQGLFAGTVATIIGFYFGSRTSETKSKSDAEAEPDAQPQ